MSLWIWGGAHCYHFDFVSDRSKNRQGKQVSLSRRSEAGLLGQHCTPGSRLSLTPIFLVKTRGRRHRPLGKKATLNSSSTVSLNSTAISAERGRTFWLCLLSIGHRHSCTSRQGMKVLYDWTSARLYKASKLIHTLRPGPPISWRSLVTRTCRMRTMRRARILAALIGACVWPATAAATFHLLMEMDLYIE